MDVCRDCCVLSGTDLCDELITRLEEAYRLWSVVVCDLETSTVRRPWPALGRRATEKKSSIQFSINDYLLFTYNYTCLFCEAFRVCIFINLVYNLMFIGPCIIVIVE